MSEMIEFSLPIPEEGLINYLATKGFSDDVFVVGEERIPCISYLVKDKNETLRKIMEDIHREKEIRISEEVSKIGFEVLLRYYGYGKVIINENNVVDTLVASVCYKEEKLVYKCKDFVETHPNIPLIQEIFDFIPCGRVLDYFKEIFKDYMMIYGYKLLDDSILMRNNIEILKYLLSIDNLVIKSNDYIVGQLNKFADRIPIKRTSENNEKSEIDEIKKMVNDNEMNRIYIDPQPTANEGFNKLFYCYCLCHNEMKNKWIRSEENYKIELKKFESISLEKCVCKLLRSKVVLTLSNTVDLINDFNLKYDDVNEIGNDILNLLSSEYNIVKFYHNKKKSVMKALLLICNNSIFIYFYILVELIPIIKYKCNDPNIFDDFYSLLPKYHSFCKELFYTFKSNNKRLLLSKIKTREIPPIYFGYENMNYKVDKIPMIIESGFIGEGCEFSINNGDESEIECDEYTGDLTMKKNVNKNYSITCENDFGFKCIDLSINTSEVVKRRCNYMFQSGYKSNRNIKIDTTNGRVTFQSINDYIVFDHYDQQYSVTCTCSNVRICCCTTKDDKGEKNKKYDIIEFDNSVKSCRVFIDMSNKQLGCYNQKNEKKIIHSNINIPVFFMVAKTNNYNSFFAYHNAEKKC